MKDISRQIKGGGHSHDDELAYRCFTQDSSRLFSGTANEFERFQWSSPPWSERHKEGGNELNQGLDKSGAHVSITSPSCQSRKIDGTDEETVDEILMNDENLDADVLYVFKQNFSWGPLNTTQHTFQKILACHGVSSSFLYFVHAFGRKVDDNNISRDGYHFSTSYRPEEYRELSYNIQHFEKNGRPNCAPWSLRQVGIYHQYNLGRDRSRWILLNPSKNIQDHIDHVVKDTPTVYDAKHMGMIIHLTLLLATCRNWPEYLDYLQNTIKELNEKACFSRVGRECHHDYKITFADCQNLQRLRDKIQKVALVLDSCAEVAEGCKELCRSIYVDDEKGGQTTLQSIENYIKRIHRHQKQTDALLDRCISTEDLISKILAFRDNEFAQSNHHAMIESLEMLKCLSLQGREENVKLTELATQSHKDSRMLKALTVVATTYLPGTFLATIFSSNLVQTVTKPNGETRMAMADQFWVFVAVALPLMVITLGFALWLERKWLRHSLKD